MTLFQDQTQTVSILNIILNLKISINVKKIETIFEFPATSAITIRRVIRQLKTVNKILWNITKYDKFICLKTV